MASGTLRKNDGAGHGNKSLVYKVSPTIVVKALSDQKHEEEHPFRREIEFYGLLAKRQDRCPDIIECFLALPNYLFLSYCDLNRIDLRFYEYQDREKRVDGFSGRFIRMNNYEDPALIARWIQQVTSAIEYLVKMGFCHNDLHPRNCLLDKRLNLRLCVFDRVATVGQFLEGVFAPWARKLTAGPLKGSYGLCCARTEQFTVGTLVYFMVYGHEPYEGLDLDPGELSRRFSYMEFPELNRHAVFDEFISACGHNVYPTMAPVAYDVKRKTKDIASDAEYEMIDCVKEGKACHALIRGGLLGPDLAFRFRPAWQKCLCVASGKVLLLWRSFVGFLRGS